MKNIIGTGSALVTPFNKDLTIDFESLEKLINYNISGGINYFVLLGTTSEVATLSESEKKSLIDFIIKVNNNRVPLVLGLGSNNTNQIVEQLKNTDLSAFDSILSVCPYYNKPNQEGIYQHYKAISENSSKPIILYNVPGRTVINMNPSTTLRLANDFKNIVAIKEAAPSFVQTLEILKNKPKDFIVLSGDDDLANSQILAGAKGVISVLAQAFPKDFTNMINLSLEGKNKESFDIYYKLMNLMILIFEEGSPAGIKTVLNNLGLVKPFVRLPLVAASENLITKINLEINKLT